MQLSVTAGRSYMEPMNASMRWRHASPKLPWAGVVDAVEYGNSCPSASQPPFLSHPTVANRPYDEDCGFLNVWSPSVDVGEDTQLLPVLLSVDSR